VVVSRSTHGDTDMPLKKFAVSIDEKVLEDFKEQLEEKYNRKDGFMGVEVEMAIRDWMKKGMQPCPKRQYNKTPKTEGGDTLDPNTKNISINKKTKNLVEHMMNYPKNHIGLGTLHNEITAATGTSSPQHLTKYVQVLENMNVIENEGIQNWKINKDWIGEDV